MAMLGYLYFVSYKRETVYSTALKAQQEEAKPYEEELQDFLYVLIRREDTVELERVTLSAVKIAM